MLMLMLVKVYWTEFSVNVSCSNADCGLVNVSLDPVFCSGTVTSQDGFRLQVTDVCGAYIGDYIGFTSGTLAGSCYLPDDFFGTDIYFFSGFPTGVAVDDAYILSDTLEECESGVIQAKSGLVSTNSSHEFFYTNKSSNPYTINLSADESETVTFWVNATGELNTTHEFFAFANRTADMTQNDETNHFNVTIHNFPPVAQNVVISSDDVLNGSNSNLTGSFSYYDQDGHSQVDNETKWFVNGTQDSSFDNLTYIASGNLTRFDNWTFSVRFNDGLEWGDWFNSSNFTVENYVPSVSDVVLTSTSGNNLTTDNLSVTFSSSDSDGDSLTNITDWREDGTSIAVLNMPFDSQITSTASGAVKDYSTYGNNGTLGGGTPANAPTWTSSGQVGGAYSF